MQSKLIIWSKKYVKLYIASDAGKSDYVHLAVAAKIKHKQPVKTQQSVSFVVNKNNEQFIILPIDFLLLCIIEDPEKREKVTVTTNVINGDPSS